MSNATLIYKNGKQKRITCGKNKSAYTWLKTEIGAYEVILDCGLGLDITQIK